MITSKICIRKVMPMGRTWKEEVPPKALPNKEELFSDSWMRDMDRAWISNDGILVYSRLVNAGKILVEHVVITSKDEREILWLTKQHIKNDLFGSTVEAIELYPEERSRTNTERTYHLWIPAQSSKIPFGLDRKKLVPVDRGHKRDVMGFLVELAEILKIPLEGGD